MAVVGIEDPDSDPDPFGCHSASGGSRQDTTFIQVFGKPDTGKRAQLGSSRQLDATLRAHAAMESNPEVGKTRQRSSSSFENPAQRHHLYLILRQPCSHSLRYLCSIVGIAMNARAVGADGNTGAVAQGDRPLARQDKRPFGDLLRGPAPLRP